MKKLIKNPAFWSTLVVVTGLLLWGQPGLATIRGILGAKQKQEQKVKEQNAAKERADAAKPPKDRKFVSWEGCLNNECQPIPNGGLYRIDKNCSVSEIDEYELKREISCDVPNTNGQKGPIDKISCGVASAEKRLKFQYSPELVYEVICNRGDK